MKWIDVNKRKPEILVNVIYKTDVPIHKPLGMQNRTVFWGYWNGHGWSDENLDLYTHVKNVTHWLDESE